MGQGTPKQRSREISYIVSAIPVFGAGQSTASCGSPLVLAGDECPQPETSGLTNQIFKAA